MRLTEFAAAMGSAVVGLKEDFEIGRLTTLEMAGPHDLSFVSNAKYAAACSSSKAGALIVPEGSTVDGHATVPMAEPWKGVVYLLNALHPEDRFDYFSGVHPSAIVDPSATLGHRVSVGPNAVIGPAVKIGDRTVIGPGAVIEPSVTIGSECRIRACVVIGPETEIGDRVIIQPGAVVGADGFKYEVVGGRITKVPQVGRVVVESDVEIGANTCIDRASFTATRVGRGSKIDNLVQIAHNVTVGAHCIIVSQTGVAGSTEVGDGSILAAQVGLADHIKIGKRSRIHARSGLMADIPDDSQVLGEPAQPYREAMKIYASFSRLPKLIKEVMALRARVEELEKGR